MQYEPIPEFTPATITEILERGDAEELLRGVLAAALYWDDGPAAEALCFQLSSHPHPHVRGNAVLGLGHLARRFGRLDLDRAVPVVTGARDDADDYVRGQAEAAWGDIQLFALDR